MIHSLRGGSVLQHYIQKVQQSLIIKHLSKGRKKTANNDKRNNESILSKKRENALKSNGLNDFYLSGNNTVNGKM